MSSLLFCALSSGFVVLVLSISPSFSASTSSSSDSSQSLSSSCTNFITLDKFSLPAMENVLKLYYDYNSVHYSEMYGEVVKASEKRVELPIKSEKKRIGIVL